MPIPQPRQAFPAYVDRVAFPFDVFDIDVDGATFAYVDAGDRDADRVFVLSHGTPCWSVDWRHLIPALAPWGRVIAVDHLGFGLSSRPRDADYSPEAHAARFAGLMDAIVPHDVDVDVIAHDFGGPFSWPWAKNVHTQGRLRSLTMLNTFCWAPIDDDDLRLPARFAGTSMMRWLYRHINASQQLIARSAFATGAAWRAARPAILGPFAGDADARERVLYALAKSMTTSTAFFRGLEAAANAFADVPTLIAWGMRDSAFTPQALTRLSGLFAHAQVYRSESAGHWPHDEDAAAVVGAISAFVAQIPPRVPVQPVTVERANEGE